MINHHRNTWITCHRTPWAPQDIISLEGAILLAVMTKQFTDGCATCQQMKTNTHPTAMPCMPIKSHAHWPFQQVTMDFITNLPISNGFDFIFIMVDQGLSKGVILRPCNKTIDAEGTIKLYIDNVFIQFRLPDIIVKVAFVSSCFHSMSLTQVT